jgi:L-aspartate oxidase
VVPALRRRRAHPSRGIAELEGSAGGARGRRRRLARGADRRADRARGRLELDVNDPHERSRGEHSDHRDQPGHRDGANDQHDDEHDDQHGDDPGAAGYRDEPRRDDRRERAPDRHDAHHDAHRPDSHHACRHSADEEHPGDPARGRARDHHARHPRAGLTGGGAATAIGGRRDRSALAADTVPAMASVPSARTHEADIAVVGAGAAGLYAALCAAREDANVVLVSATPLAQTASYWAQGGLAAALAEDDSFELHLEDTEVAGRGLVRRSAAEVLVREAPDCVHDLQALGVRFDVDRFGALALGLEGGHSVRRVVHAGGSATGRRVVRQLSALAAREPRITVFENARAEALWRADERCRGLVCDDGRVIAARAVMIATGGAAALWARTTNPPGSQGVGLLLAHAAGAALADLELMQFHPTAVIGIAGREGFLVTEAIRGEGATLHDSSGERFVDELAPRDEVSRAIQARLEASGERSVGLDMRAIDPAHFPNIVAALREAGVDPASELIPVAPAAHYMMGGIVADLNARSTLPGLYAVGESSCTGLHGANRLASNSLSECFVFARRAVADALAHAVADRAPSEAELRELRELPAPAPATHATREALWHDAGIVRTPEGLGRLLGDAHPLAREIARCGLARTESRGAHLRADHPERDPAFDHRHVLVAGEESLSWQDWR